VKRNPLYLAQLASVVALLTAGKPGLIARQTADNSSQSGQPSAQSSSSGRQSSQDSGQTQSSKPSGESSTQGMQPASPASPAEGAAVEAKPAQPIVEVVPDRGRPDAGPLIRQGESALDRKDYQSAVVSLKAATQRAPDNVTAWFDLGYAYTGLHQDNQARDAYEKAAALNPTLFEARFNLGVLLVDMKQFHAAVPELQEAAKLRPSDARPYLFLGRALAGDGQTAAAATVFHRTLELDPKQPTAAYELAQVDFNQKQFAAAAADFQKALEIDPRLAEAELGAAAAQEALGNIREAEAAFNQYLQLRPTDTTARYHLARLYLQQKQAEQALAELTQVEKSQPAIPGLMAALGDAYALAGKFGQSEVYYRRALAASTDGHAPPELHRALAESLLKEGKTGDAEREFRAALQTDPNNADDLKGLASSLYLERRFADAAPIIERLLQTPSASSGLYFILATCYDHLHDLPHALAAYQQFLAKSHGASPDQEWQARQREKLISREMGKPL
jgi:Flp pilus assembly protein TadD